MPIPSRVLIALICLSVLAVSSESVRGQTDPAAPNDDGIELLETRTVLALAPADEPRPALKHQLLPSLIERRPGNAVVFYGKVKAEQTAFFNSKEVREELTDYLVLPLDEVLDHPGVQRVASNSTIFTFLRYGARCESADWQLPIREEPFYTILLPQTQETRQLARLLAARARYRIASGDYEGAIESMQDGMALARNISLAPTLINGLVGYADFRIISEQLLTMSGQPGSPNMYWALSTLPQPLVVMRPGMESELHALRLSIPALADVEDMSHGKEYWDDTLGETVRLLDELNGSNFRFDDADLATKAGVTLLALRAYPMAKESLLENGWDAETIESLPVSQVVLIRAMQQYELVRDYLFRYMELPYYESQPATTREVEDILADYDAGPEALPIAASFIPAINAVNAARARQDQYVAMLRIIEAIRIYGARHDGQLPDSLDAVTYVPIPNDPVTGGAFEYERRGDTAILQGGELPGNRAQFEIRFVE